jgi:hypothetical protein
MRDGRDAREKQDGRDSKFEVLNTSNFGPRTVVRLAFPASLACLARLSCWLGFGWRSR